MNKIEEMRRSTTLGGRSGAFPPGTDPAQAIGRPARMEGVRGDRSAAWIAVDRIERDPDQPREEFDPEALSRLAESLKKGQVQPIRVRWDEGRGMYVLIAGERRWRAAQQAGLKELQAVIHDGALAPDEILGLQLVENALREDLRPVEQARAYRRLMDARGWTMTELAAELNLHQTTVSRALALLDLEEGVQARVDSRALAASAAAEIAKLPREDQAPVAAVVEEQKLGRDEVVEVVKAVRAKRTPPAPKPEPVTVDLGACTVQVKWKKADPMTAQQALRKALKALQEREQQPDGQAA
jgi:ParB family transcriptional regulator, chromosome partitioning protein